MANVMERMLATYRPSLPPSTKKAATAWLLGMSCAGVTAAAGAGCAAECCGQYSSRFGAAAGGKHTKQVCWDMLLLLLARATLQIQLVMLVFPVTGSSAT
jgi:hypothetical protein